VLFHCALSCDWGEAGRDSLSIVIAKLFMKLAPKTLCLAVQVAHFDG
jgi:hypothetical protein